MNEAVDIAQKNVKVNGRPPLESAGSLETVYQLNPQERKLAAQAISYEASVKARVYDLQEQLDLAKKDLIGATAQRQGAMAMLVQSRGWEDGAISDDFSTLTKRGPRAR